MVQASMFARILKWAGLGFLSFFILLCVSLLIALWPGIPARVPLVKFHYQAAIDRYLCSSEGKSRILPSWHTELETKFSLLKDEWSNVGPKLLAETSKLIGTPFSHSEYDIPIFLCPSLPGIGFPIMIPIRMYLKNAVVEKPWDKSEFVDMVYHEILHLYIARALHWNFWTPLLSKYRDEKLNTKIHLHLFAVQKAVYVNLGLRKQWKVVVTRNREFSSQYSRAIDIIEKEGYQPFIDELN